MEKAEHIVDEAIELARKWQKRANGLITPEEKGRQKQLAALLANPMDKVILTKMIDQGFRSGSNRRIADQIYYLLSEHGIPKFFSPLETLLMLVFLKIGRYFPDLTVPKIIAKMRQDRKLCCMHPWPPRRSLSMPLPI